MESRESLRNENNYKTEWGIKILQFVVLAMAYPAAVYAGFKIISFSVVPDMTTVTGIGDVLKQLFDGFIIYGFLILTAGLTIKYTKEREFEVLLICYTGIGILFVIMFLLMR